MPVNNPLVGSEPAERRGRPAPAPEVRQGFGWPHAVVLLVLTPVTLAATFVFWKNGVSLWGAFLVTVGLVSVVAFIVAPKAGAALMDRFSNGAVGFKNGFKDGGGQS